jgi:hypothetical protein
VLSLQFFDHLEALSLWFDHAEELSFVVRSCGGVVFAVRWCRGVVICGCTSTLPRKRGWRNMSVAVPGHIDRLVLCSPWRAAGGTTCRWQCQDALTG